MSNGARPCLVLSMSLLSISLLSMSVSAQYASSECPRECDCIQNGDKTEYSCSETQLIVGNDKTATVNCVGATLDCSKLPNLNFVRGGQLNVLRVERCGVESSLQCVLTHLNATSIRRLYLNEQQTPVTEETVKGLIGLESFWIFSSGVQKVVPVDSLKVLPSLNMLRLSGVGLTEIPSNTFYDADRPMGQHLTFLDISINNITSLQRNSFFGLSKLNNITIFKNNIHHVDANTFEGVGGLLKLDFADESISTLPPGLFAHTPLLFYLSIPRNAVELRLDEGVISSLTHLKELIIKDALKLTLGPLALSNLTSLSTLDLSGSDIAELPEDLFLNTTNLTSLDLSNNNLSFLPHKLFFGMHNLRDLKISKNKLENISRELFESMADIKEIYLDGNRIKSLPDALFSSSHLRVLSLARNHIEEITIGTFQGSSSLKSLDLSHNLLSWDCRVKNGDQRLFISGRSVLQNLERLNILDLSYNNIQSVCDDWMHVMTSLHDLNMSNNGLDFLSSIQLNFLSDNLAVNFENNSITTIANDVHGTLPIIDQNHINQIKFKLGSNPFHCDCQFYNLLQSLNTNTFDLTDAQCTQPQSLERVALIDIAEQRLDSLTCPVNGSESCECLFRPSKRIIECSCKDIHNLVLPNSTFDIIAVMKVKLLKSQLDLTGLPKYVTELDLSGLGLDSIPNLPNTVRELNLSNNRLKEIPLEILHKNIKTLMLENNPLGCGCSYMDNVKNLKRYYQKISNFSELLCSDGSTVKGKDLSALCDVYYSTVIGVSCLVAAVILAVIIVLMYKFLPEVQVILFYIGLKRIVREEWMDKGKIYDIFLSYTVKDEHFVREILLPKLEEMKFKVCEHSRDWEIGRQIPEQIYTSVANSKKTLFVMSENFLKSVWVLEEFNATILQGAKDRTNRAVVILLDDVNLDEAPITIRHHLALNTYIKWNADNKAFWTKLYNALPKKLTANEIKKRQKAVKAVKALGTGLNVVLNEEGKLVNIADVKKNVYTPPEIIV